MKSLTIFFTIFPLAFFSQVNLDQPLCYFTGNLGGNITIPLSRSKEPFESITRNSIKSFSIGCQLEVFPARKNLGFCSSLRIHSTNNRDQLRTQITSNYPGKVISFIGEEIPGSSSLELATGLVYKISTRKKWDLFLSADFGIASYGLYPNVRFLVIDTLNFSEYYSSTKILKSGFFPRLGLQGSGIYPLSKMTFLRLDISHVFLWRDYQYETDTQLKNEPLVKITNYYEDILYLIQIRAGVGIRF